MQGVVIGTGIDPGDEVNGAFQGMCEEPRTGRKRRIRSEKLGGNDPGAAGRLARQAIPELNVTTDVIVGFPTEDDAAFGRTLEVVDAVRFGKVHVFPYSPRPGTRAAALGDGVSPADKDARSRELRDRSDRLGFARRRERIGSRDVVLVEKLLDDGTATGYGSDYTRFVVPSVERGQLLPVVADGMLGEHLRGIPIEEA